MNWECTFSMPLRYSFTTGLGCPFGVPFPFPGEPSIGAVSEWFKVQSWKDCVGLYPTGSSNLPRSATF